MRAAQGPRNNKLHPDGQQSIPVQKIVTSKKIAS